MSRRKDRVRLRRHILDLYGRRCNNCGFDKDERVLQLDHIDGQPHLIKGLRGGSPRSGNTLYSAILSGAVPDHMFQMLCANCNFLKRLITPSENRGARIWDDEDLYVKNSEIVEHEIIGEEQTELISRESYIDY